MIDILKILKREMSRSEEEFLEWMGKIPELLGREEKIELESIGWVKKWGSTVSSDFVAMSSMEQGVTVIMCKSGKVTWTYTNQEHWSENFLQDFYWSKAFLRYKITYKNVRSFLRARDEKAEKERREKICRKLFE